MLQRIPAVRSPLSLALRSPLQGMTTTIQQAISLLRSLGTSAHVWIPGIGSINGLASNNYLLSDGSTGLSSVDSVVGLDLDAMGSLSTAEMVTNGTFDTNTTSWVSSNSATLTRDTSIFPNGGLKIVATSAAANSGASQALVIATVVSKSYVISADMYAPSSNTVVNGAVISTEFAPIVNSALSMQVTAEDVVQSKSFVFVATATTTAIYAYILNRGVAWGSVGDAAYFDNISVKEYTGNHLTQATTANKPLLRRGLFNELIYSHTLSNAAWVTQLTASKSGSNLLIPADSDNLYQLTALPAGTYTFGVLMSGTGTVSLFGFTGVQGPFSITSYTLTSTPTLYALTLVSTGANLSVNIGRQAGATATSVTLGGMGLFKGTWTAAQILAEGGIPTTTSTAASNPSAGKYWWSFNHAGIVAPDSLLSTNLGITNAVTITVAGVVNSLATIQTLFAEDVNGVQIYIDTSGIVTLVKFGVSLIVNTAAATIVAGVPFVITVRLLSGNAVIRKNSAEVATAATALAFSATTGARVGSNFDGTTQPVRGGMGFVIPITSGLTDAQCLLVERLAAANFPNGPVF